MSILNMAKAREHFTLEYIKKHKEMHTKRIKESKRFFTRKIKNEVVRRIYITNYVKKVVPNLIKKLKNKSISTGEVQDIIFHLERDIYEKLEKDNTNFTEGIKKINKIINYQFLKEIRLSINKIRSNLTREELQELNKRFNISKSEITPVLDLADNILLKMGLNNKNYNRNLTFKYFGDAFELLFKNIYTNCISDGLSAVGYFVKLFEISNNKGKGITNFFENIDNTRTYGIYMNKRSYIFEGKYLTHVVIHEYIHNILEQHNLNTHDETLVNALTTYVLYKNNIPDKLLTTSPEKYMWGITIGKQIAKETPNIISISEFMNKYYAYFRNITN